MRLGGEPVGRWGIALLVITGLAGLGLAVHGWSARGGAGAPALASSARPSAAARARAPRPAASRHASAGAPPSAAARPGPLLKSEPYASAAFQIWPGKPSVAAKTALTGLSVSVHRRGGALAVTAGVSGQSAGPPRLYPGGARVYVVEASLGDDSGGSDYNLGDDGLVVTNSEGRIIG